MQVFVTDRLITAYQNIFEELVTVPQLFNKWRKGYYFKSLVKQCVYMRVGLHLESIIKRSQNKNKTLFVNKLLWLAFTQTERAIHNTLRSDEFLQMNLPIFAKHFFDWMINSRDEYGYYNLKSPTKMYF